MEEERAIVAFCVFLLLVALTAVYFNTTYWHKEIAYHQAHPNPGWKIEQGYVAKQGKIDFSTDPPLALSTVVFRDYRGHQQTAQLHVEGTSYNGMPLEVDVSDTGSIYVPRSDEYDWYNGKGSWKGPKAAHNTKTIFLMFLSWVIGIAAAIALYYGLVLIPQHLRFPMRGRLGSR